MERVKVSPGKSYPFSFSYALLGSPLPLQDAILPSSPFTFQLYLSKDKELDRTDFNLQYNLTEGNAGMISADPGQAPPYNVTIVEYVNGIVALLSLVNIQIHIRKITLKHRTTLQRMNTREAFLCKFLI